MKYTFLLLVLVLSRSVCEDTSETDSSESDESDSSDSDCEQPIDFGHCSNDTTRYAFISDNDECLEFTYKGCGGNNNNFETRNECENACLTSSSDSESDDTISI